MGDPGLSAGPAELACTPAATPPVPVAIVHDYLNQRGGAERVVLELASMWPQAPIYTSLYRPTSTFPGFGSHDVRVSPLDRLPLDAGFRALAPLYPLAFRALGVLDQEIVISSSSGWAHGIRAARGSLHVVYCHTPARWLYRRQEHLGSGWRPRLMSPLRRPLTRWDQAAAVRADVFVANSEHVRERIRRIYDRDAFVVHPPVAVERFTPRERGERLLVVSRLLPYKRIDLVVGAATRLGLGLDVVGVGPQLDELRRIAGPSVRMLGTVGENALVELFETCRAVCVPGVEDFGITAVEAQAAGKPVVAYAAGGALETVVDGETGVLFHEQHEDAVLAALRRADVLEANPARLAAGAARFSARVFRERFIAVVEAARAAKRDPTSLPE